MYAIKSKFKTKDAAWCSFNTNKIDHDDSDNERKAFRIDSYRVLIHCHQSDLIVANGKAIMPTVPARNSCAPMSSAIFEISSDDFEIFSTIGGFGGQCLPGDPSDIIVWGWKSKDTMEIYFSDLPEARPLYVWREDYPHPYPRPVYGSEEEARTAFNRESDAPKRIGGHPAGDARTCSCPDLFDDFASVLISR